MSSISEKISAINTCQNFKHVLVRSDFTLEKKETSLLGRFCQWIRRVSNPKLYKPEHVFKALITYASFHPSEINLQGAQFTDLTKRLRTADRTGCSFLKQNIQALQIYEATSSAFSEIRSDSQIPYAKILKTALLAQGYDLEKSNDLIDILAQHNQLVSDLQTIERQNGEQKVGSYLFQLAEDIAKAHIKKCETRSISVYSISKEFDDYFVGGSSQSYNLNLRQALNKFFSENTAPGFTRVSRESTTSWMIGKRHSIDRF